MTAAKGPEGPFRSLIRDEEGQALLYGAGMLVLLVALFFGMLDLGWLVLGKVESQNAADAAALSASGLKASVHNTRELAYRAMSGQVTIARAYLLEATGIAIDELAGSTPGTTDSFDTVFKKAQSARSKAERLRNGLIAFNEWVTGQQAGQTLVQQAAEAGYTGNLGSLGVMRGNLGLMQGEQALPENSHTFGTTTVGGVAYTGEALAPNTFAGKTLVRLYPKVATFGSGMLGYGAQALVDTESAAGPLPVSRVDAGGTGAVDRFGVNWYTVRLMPVGKDPDFDKGGG
ncbi:MAG TPA: pilus assembly protein TadG-related protein [Oscillatoriaceae cyanobacterium]